MVFPQFYRHKSWDKPPIHSRRSIGTNKNHLWSHGWRPARAVGREPRGQHWGVPHRITGFDVDWLAVWYLCILYIYICMDRTVKFTIFEFGFISIVGMDWNQVVLHERTIQDYLRSGPWNGQGDPRWLVKTSAMAGSPDWPIEFASDFGKAIFKHPYFWPIPPIKMVKLGLVDPWILLSVNWH